MNRLALSLAVGTASFVLLPAACSERDDASRTGAGGGAGMVMSSSGGAGGDDARPVCKDHWGLDMSGVGGEAGARDGAGESGAATGHHVPCTFVEQHELSSAISTVGIVKFTSDLAGMDAARIEFGYDGGCFASAPVDLTEPDNRTLLLGMKAEHDYAFRIIASAGRNSCVSPIYELTTGSLPSNLPMLTQRVPNPAAQDPGFILTCGGLTPNANTFAVIIDADGDVVWWAPAPITCGRVHMSWDAKSMWMMKVDFSNDGGEVRHVSMEGLQTEEDLSAFQRAHHDMAVLPEGGFATFLWNGAGPAVHNSLVEQQPDGTNATVIADLATIYASNGFHPNAIHYHPADDTFTISDRVANLFVKISRGGQLVWQLGGTAPLGNSFDLGGNSWLVNHGHHLLANGNFLFFSNGAFEGGTSIVYEYSLDEISWTASPVWSYKSSFSSPVLGDVERLPNGNTLVTYSARGVIQEVGPEGALVRSLTAATFGYADFRESLYGPPPR